jgi:thiopeptide-type bacteriocin biosynthesis protein
MSSTNGTWLGAHLYYAEPWEKFLVEAVHPFVVEVVSKKLAEQFFFIRYWERGPHIRLRLKGERYALEHELKPWLESFFLEYFHRCPSRRDEVKNRDNLPSDRSWYPNNSIQSVRYEPEIDRYGGSESIVIAERQFELSSRAALCLFNEYPDWDYDRALGSAIQLHLAFAYAVGMSLNEARLFYSQVFGSWFRLFLAPPDPDVQSQPELILKAFEESFDKQKPVLAPFHQALWNALNEKANFEKEWMNTWIKEMKTIGSQLKECQESRHLSFPAGLKADPHVFVPESNQALWFILESYVHMTNNRLGILNRDEAFLGYLISRCLDCISDSS